MTDDGVRGARPGRNPDKPRRVMRKVAKEVKRLAHVEADREIRIREGTADVHDLLAKRPDADWYGLRNDIRREADNLRASARLDIAKAFSRPDRVEAFVNLINRGIDGQSRVSQRTAAIIVNDFLKQPDAADHFENVVLKQVGASSIEELIAIVKKAKATAEMDAHQRAEVCERYLVGYYGIEGRTRQRLGIRFMGGELPVTSEESGAVIVPEPDRGR